jgi:hypothetical protein
MLSKLAVALLDRYLIRTPSEFRAAQGGL